MRDGVGTQRVVLSAGAVARAIEEWGALLGAGGVDARAETLEKYGRTTHRDAPRPLCVLFPESTDAVQGIVRIAASHGVVLYPISKGKNWGYGDACAPTEGAAIVDLGRMNRIVEVSTELAYCVVEPGVTQRQLYDYLQEHNTGLWMDATAAGGDSSLVGNTVDRGFGHTRYGDHFATCSGMEIVLADGRVLNTGFGHFEGARATQVYPYGVGPYLDGLFTQSNLGIVTKIGLWLMPAPKAFNFFYFQVERFEDFGRVVDALRPLRLAGILQTAIHIGNDFRVLAGGGRYPWEEARGQAPLPAELRVRLRKRRGAMAWQGAGSLTGAREHVRGGRKALRRALRGICDVHFLDDRKLEFAERSVAWLNRFGIAKEMGERLKIVRPNFDLLKGVPTEEPLMGAQWRLRHPPAVTRQAPGDPLDHGCGLYWVSPVMPMLGREAMTLLSLVEPVFEKHGFDMIVSFILLTERSLVAIFNVAFDKSVAGEPEAASACYEALVDTMMGSGFTIYRCGLQGMPKLYRGSSVFWEVNRQIKEALDPGDIIARGRYNAPLGSWEK